MTSEEIDVLKAGRELDMLVAQSVFGWARPDALKNIANDYRLIYPNSNNWIEPPRYSTHMSEAWKIVDAINDMGEKTQEVFDGYFIYHQIELRQVSPYRICIAALKAVMAEKGNEE